MTEIECTHFLQWCLPQMGLRWAGIRKVRRLVCKRCMRRMRDLGLPMLSAYGEYLKDHPGEWKTLDSLCRITISRFYRDRKVFDGLGNEILPFLARSILASGGTEVRCWSAGCSSGEEPYTIRIIWNFCVTPLMKNDMTLKIIATDADEGVLLRAREGMYRMSSLKDLPEELIQRAFIKSGEFYSLRQSLRENVEFRLEDIRESQPEETFHLILCRNLVLTYFEEPLRQRVMEEVVKRLRPGGLLVIGVHESLPARISGMKPFTGSKAIYVKSE